MQSILSEAPWAPQHRTLRLENVDMNDTVLIWALNRFSGLQLLHLASAQTVRPKVAAAFAKQPSEGEEWLCPVLEELEFGKCRNLDARSLKQLVRVRVEQAAPDSAMAMDRPKQMKKVTWGKRDMIMETLGT